MAKKDKVPAKPKLKKPTLSGEALERIFENLADGLSLRQAAANHGHKEQDVHNYMKRHPEWREKYACACELRRYHYESRLLDLLVNGHEAAMDEVSGPTRVRAIQLEVDTLKWLLCKLMPHKYGDKQALEVTGKDGSPLLPQHTKAELAEFAALLASARAKTDQPDK